MMRSTTDVIREWHEEGQKQKASHLIVLRDRLDGSLSPLYARHEDDTKEIVRDYSREENERFVSVDSVFKLNKTMEEQEDLFNY